MLVALLLLLATVRADVITHFAQSAEIGVEQLEKFADTDKITFFAAVRQEKNLADYDYVLSFAEPSCEATCTQSLNSSRMPHADWEHIEIAHYPTPTDPAAVYIRKTFSMSALDCAEGFTITRDADGKVLSLSGALFLSIWERTVDQCIDFKRSDTFHFEIGYNAADNSFTGLDYDLSKYEYSAEATRNIRLDGIGLMVEITTVLQNMQAGLVDTATMFETATIFAQDCQPAMKLLTSTVCAEGFGQICTQRFYLLPIDSVGTAYSMATGNLEIHASFSPDGSQYNMAILHVELNIAPTDYGHTERDIDLVVASYNDTTLVPYIDNDHGTDNLEDAEEVCVMVASPVLLPMRLNRVAVCASESTDLSLLGCRTEGVADMKTMQVYNDQSPVNSGTLSQPEGKGYEFSYCFKIKKLGSAAHFLDVTYQPITGELERSESSGDGAMILQRRVMGGDSATSQDIWVDCPYGWYWDYVACTCVPNNGINDNDLTTWEIVLLVFLGLAVCGVCIFIFAFADNSMWGNYYSDGTYQKPYYVPILIPNPQNPKRYVRAWREEHSGKVVTHVTIDDDGVEVIGDGQLVRRKAQNIPNQNAVWPS